MVASPIESCVILLYSPKNNSDSLSLALVSFIPYIRSPRVGILAGELNANGLPMRTPSISEPNTQTSGAETRAGEGTHRSWNLSTQTGSLPAPRGTWGQAACRHISACCGDCEPQDVRRGAGMAASGSLLLRGEAVRDLWSRRKGLSRWSRAESPPGLHASSSCAQGSPEAT